MCKRKVLIADDHGYILESLAEILCDYFECVVVSKLEDVLRLVREQYFDVCILDLVYEGEGILDVYGLIERHRDLKVIIISGYTSQLDMQLLDKARVIVLPKPFSIQELTDSLARFGIEKRKLN